MEIRPLTATDLPDALRLSTQAGWNQTPVHWQRFLTVCPQGAVAGCVNGKVVATGTLAVYDPGVAWIGMILVDEAMRGHGLGTKIFTAMLDRARELNIHTLGLDASNMGQPLYRKHGFVDQQEIDRWVCPKVNSTALGTEDSAIRSVRSGDWKSIQAIDRDATGVDRLALLQHIAREPGAALLVQEQHGALRGYAMLQDGRFGRMLGPIVAEDASTATRLLHHLIRHALTLDSPGGGVAKGLVLDCLRPSPLAPVLASLGFSVSRQLTRMARPASQRVLLASDCVFAGAGFELG